MTVPHGINPDVPHSARDSWLGGKDDFEADRRTSARASRPRATPTRSRRRRTPRTGEQITRCFDGFDLVEPGLVAVSEWHHPPLFADPATWRYAGVGHKR
ncbi:SAM-dependent methyltransferase [Nonomuraea sp. NPDC049625]|uniref:SAM-dependent methyltransferase n=1 Tax=Nonomuraea sp. NPDC049625 TaxID=3155775 RepID=UPI003434B9B7